MSKPKPILRIETAAIFFQILEGELIPIICSTPTSGVTSQTSQSSLFCDVCDVCGDNDVCDVCDVFSVP